jgi:hypothetical protein
MIPARWLPSLPPANGWLPVNYEVSEESGILRRRQAPLGLGPVAIAAAWSGCL